MNSALNQKARVHITKGNVNIYSEYEMIKIRGLNWEVIRRLKRVAKKPESETAI